MFKKIEKVISLFDKHMRGSGDAPGVVDRVNDYMKDFIDPLLTTESIVLDCGAGDCYTYDFFYFFKH